MLGDLVGPEDPESEEAPLGSVFGGYFLWCRLAVLRHYDGKKVLFFNVGEIYKSSREFEIPPATARKTKMAVVFGAEKYYLSKTPTEMNIL